MATESAHESVSSCPAVIRREVVANNAIALLNATHVRLLHRDGSDVLPHPIKGQQSCDAIRGCADLREAVECCEPLDIRAAIRDTSGRAAARSFAVKLGCSLGGESTSGGAVAKVGRSPCSC